MNYFPLLDIKQALADADRNLADVVDYVHALLYETDGHCPRQADVLLANIAIARELLGRIIPPQCQEDIAREQAFYDEEESRHSY
jgi:hypothetical protein